MTGSVVGGHERSMGCGREGNIYIYFNVLITVVQQSNSVLHIYIIYTYIYIYIHSFLIFFSIMIYHRILNIVPCAIQ